MNLAFSEQLNNTESLFIEKIWEGLFRNDPLNTTLMQQYGIFQRAYLEKFGKYWDGTSSARHEPVNPKIHTIRNDENNRWSAGKLIHPVINPRSPERFQFAPEFPCISTQYFQILYDEGYPTVYVGDDKESWMPFFFYDEESGEFIYGEDQMKKLAQNDGFDGIKEFFEYFNTDFEGRLIHFTDLKY